jgi:hypothetical protein
MPVKKRGNKVQEGAARIVALPLVLEDGAEMRQIGDVRFSIDRITQEQMKDAVITPVYFEHEGKPALGAFSLVPKKQSGHIIQTK